jgi:sulfoxide reductase catalytic subunit YedY
MLIRRPSVIPSSEITPESVYLNRREFMGQAGMLAMGAFAAPATVAAMTRVRQQLKTTDEDLVFSYNNFYEFGTAKDEPKEQAKNFRTTPWTVDVEGMVKSPKKYAIDDLLKGIAVEDRIYRHRCVEAWSMVVPWRGVSM